MKVVCRITGHTLDVAEEKVAFYVERGLILPPEKPKPVVKKKPAKKER